MLQNSFLSPRHIHKKFHPTGRMSDTATVQNAIGPVIRQCVQNLSSRENIAAAHNSTIHFPLPKARNFLRSVKDSFDLKAAGIHQVTIHADATARTDVFGFRFNASLFLSTCLLMNMNGPIGNKLFSSEFEGPVTYEGVRNGRGDVKSSFVICACLCVCVYLCSYICASINSKAQY